MLCTRLKIIFNIKTNLKYSDLENIDLRVSQAEEKYLKMFRILLPTLKGHSNQLK